MTILMFPAIEDFQRAAIGSKWLWISASGRYHTPVNLVDRGCKGELLWAVFEDKDGQPYRCAGYPARSPDEENRAVAYPPLHSPGPWRAADRWGNSAPSTAVGSK